MFNAQLFPINKCICVITDALEKKNKSVLLICNLFKNNKCQFPAIYRVDTLKYLKTKKRNTGS